MKGVLASLTVAYLVRLAQNMYQTSTPLLGKQILRLDPSAIGVVASVGSLAQILTLVLIAARIRATQARPALALGSILLGLCFAGFIAAGLAPRGGVPLYVVATVLGGVAAGLLFPTLLTRIGLGSRERRDRRLAVYTVALSAGVATSAPLEFLALRLCAGSLRGAFFAFFLCPLGALILVLLLVPGAGTDTVDGLSTQPLVPRESHRRPADRSSYRIALYSQIMYQIPYTAAVTFGALLAESSYGLSNSSVELALSVFFVVGFTGRLAVASRHHVQAKLEIFLASALLSLAGLLVIGLGHGELALLIGLVLLGLPYGAVFPLSVALIADGVAPEQLGRANAHFTAYTTGVAALVPLVVGYLVQALGYRWAFLLIACPVLAVGLGLTWSLRVKRRGL